MDNINKILPPNYRPYYIYTPPYMRTSAGVRVLHYLAHSLNQKNYPAYILPQFLLKGLPPVHPELKAPILTQEVVNLHFHEGRTPIVIYPEITYGNPLEAKCVARYILNFPGLLGGSQEFDKNEFLIYFSKDLMPTTHNNESTILFIPPSDPRTFKPPVDNKIRNKKVFYAKKFKKYHHGVLPDFTKDCIEITIGEPNSQSISEVVELFQTAKVFFAFENTALAAEALLCGCPVVLMTSPKLEGIIAKTELGMSGITFNIDDESIGKASEETVNYRLNYLKQFDKYSKDLDYFIKNTQEKAQSVEYKAIIKFKKPKIKDSKITAGIKAFIKLIRVEKFNFLGTFLNLFGSKDKREESLSKLKKIYISHR